MTLADQDGPEADSPSFDDLDLSPEVRKALEDIGYEQPTPVQHATYKPAVEGRDIIVQAQTGTGKTAAFGIPLVDRIVTDDPGVQALVLAPTRELALQSAREMQRLGQNRDTRTVAVYGGAPMPPQIKELAAGAQIVSGTPGRVLDHLRRGTLDASGLKALVLDEMDEMLSMGFAKELNAILEIIPGKEKRQTMCFSATVDGSVQRHAEQHMKDPLIVSLSSDAVGAAEISHHVYMVSGTDRTGDLIQVLNIEDPESAIVFCNMRSETEKVAQQLQQAGFNADWLNGDLPQRERERIMSRTRESKLRYLVATDVAARGIDISHLTHVINYSFPESAATYVHRTGRTGRAGRTGCAISLVAPQELGRLYYLRLEYGISPIERSLPSAGERQTRMELDRIKLLEATGEGTLTDDELALARRLLTHPEVERIVGGMLRNLFGERKNADQEAADARRARKPEPVPESDRARRADPTDSERGERPGRRPRKRRRRGERESSEGASQSELFDGEAADAKGDTKPDTTSDAKPDAKTSKKAEKAEMKAADTKAGADTPDEGDSTEPRRRRPRTRRRRGAASNPDSPDTASETAQAAEDAPDDGAESQRETGATIFLNIGRKDGARAGDVARLMRELGELEREDVGKIRVRDRYTFVDVPEEQLDAVVERLRDADFNERPLDPERARVSKS